MRLLQELILTAVDYGGSGSGRAMEAHLDAAATALVNNDVPHAKDMIDLFRKKVLLLRRQGRLSAVAADELIALADATVEILELPSGSS